MTGNIDRLFYNHQLWKYIFSPSNRCFPQKTNKWKLIAIEQSLWWWWWWIIPNEKKKQKTKMNEKWNSFSIIVCHQKFFFSFQNIYGSFHFEKEKEKKNDSKIFQCIINIFLLCVCVCQMTDFPLYFFFC